MIPSFLASVVAALLLLFESRDLLALDNSLVEAAKKEGGRVVVYGSLDSDTGDAIKTAFHKRTGITMEYWRASSTKVMDRALSEHRAGKPIFDVLINNANPMQIMFKEGILARYDSPSAKEFPKDVIDPNLGPRYRNVIIGIIYNNKMIKAAEAPKSLEDILNPRYRGKLVMPDPTQHTTTTQWLASLHKIMGQHKAEEFIRKLGATRPLLVESFIPAAERVITGETPIAIAFVRYVFIYGQKGAPVDYVRLGSMLGDGHHVALNGKAPHPSAGKAFIDYFLDTESMKLLANLGGEFVNRKGIHPPLPDADKIRFVEMLELDKKSYAEKRQEYSKIFTR
ncbi:MAG: extracellular solute-binding protein [Deltaproteobacteria bacterium]|nr:extracellular solute-binding protein [Deltaproteobacteria bacterium]